MNNTIWQVTELSRSFAVVIAVVCGRLRSFCSRLRLYTNSYAIKQTHKSEEKRGPQKQH